MTGFNTGARIGESARGGPSAALGRGRRGRPLSGGRRFLPAAVLLGIVLLSGIPGCSDQPSAEEKLEEIFHRAEEAVSEGDLELADFWIARYLGLTAYNDETKRDYADLIPLFEKRGDLESTSIISENYDVDFIRFFVRGMSGMWGGPDNQIDRDNLRVIVQASNDDSYFVAVAATPRLEGWFVMKEPQTVAVIPLGTDPVIHSGRVKAGRVVKRFQETPIEMGEELLHYVWPPKLHDLDGDGTPEVWIRYIKTRADGFSQELEIYRIVDDGRLDLLKRFSGEAEGVARRRDGNRVEVGYGFTDQGYDRRDYEQTRLESWEYRDGEFVKFSEKDLPHILRSSSWQQYYF